MDNDLDILLDNPPSLILQSGISLIGLTVLCFLFLSAFIRYPDVTIGTGVMTSETPPIDHLSNTSGIIDSFYVTENSFVRYGDQLLSIQNTCSPESIDSLRNFIKKFEDISNSSHYDKLTLPTNLQLGILQAEYADFEMAFMELQMRLKAPFFRHKIQILNEEIINLERLSLAIKKHQDLFKQEYSLIHSDHARNRTLKAGNVISDLDMEKSDKELIAAKKQTILLESNLIENEIRKGNLEFEVNKLISEQTDLNNKNILKLKGIISTLKASIKTWEEKYIIVAKTSGRVSFPSIITPYVKINENDLVASVVPTINTSYQYVRAIVPDKGIGKVKINNKVIVKVDGYPYKEYGSIISKVTAISPIPRDDKTGNLSYDLQITLPAEILTNRNIRIPFKPNTGVVVEIVTKEKSILARIFQEFLNLINKT